MKNNESNLLRDNEYEHLDTDMAAFARLLDDAGAADRARMQPVAADRIHAMSLASLHGLVDTNAQVSELGAIDRAAASPELEERVFDASRAELAGAPAGLRLAGGGSFPRPAVTVRSGWSFARVRALAAALLLGAAGVVTYIGVNQNAGKTTPVSDPAQSVETLAAQVSKQMDTLFVAMEGMSTTSTESTESDFNPEWLDDLGTSATSGGGAS